MSLSYDEVTITVTNTPVADFSPLNSTIIAGESVNFTGSSTSLPVTWEWSFPGGSPSSGTAQNQTVTYNIPGTYSVTLRTTNSCGTSVEKTGSVTVNVQAGCVQPTITRRGTTTSNTTTNTTLTINKPAGVVDGDIMIVNICKNATSSNNPSSTGWTFITSSNLQGGGGTNRYGAILYRIADGTELSNFTFNLGSGTSSAVGSIIAFSGVSSSSPFDVTPGSINNNNQDGGNVVYANGITTVTNNAAVIFLGEAGNSSWSSWSGTNPTFTEIMDNSNGNNASVAAAWGIKAAAGSTGNKTASITGNNYNGGILLALRPATIIIPTVNPISNLIKCSGDATTVTFSGSATTYYWSNSNPSIGLEAYGEGEISFTAADVTSQQTATITVTPSNGTCSGTPETFQITVIPKLTAVTISPGTAQDFCYNGTGTQLSVADGIVTGRQWGKRSRIWRSN